MPPLAWCRVGASVIGTSHEENGGLCEDAAAFIERNGAEGPVLIAVVSDGAGSAPCGRAGSRAVVRSISRAASNFVKQGGLVRDLDEETVRFWVDELRDSIAARAAVMELRPRDYAATMVAAFVSPDCAVIAHIGDGACILGAQDGYEVPIWPAHGEYASTTYFVTDDTVSLTVTCREGAFEKAAVFSDGLELLLLKNDTRAAFAPFFDSVFARLGKLSAGRDRKESQTLASFLRSEKIAKRTNDDKTLLLAHRVAQAQ